MWPVVPMTSAFLCFAQSSAMPGVAVCELKSTTASPPRDDGAEIVPGVNVAGEFESVKIRRAGDAAPGPSGLSTR